MNTNNISVKNLNNSFNFLNNSTDNIKFDKKERQENIKKLLIASIRLKMKLQKQVTLLKENVPIDEELILQHLKLETVTKSNIEDTITQNKVSKTQNSTNYNF